ncbi:coiled-coil domain-containing protein 146 [Thalassophryne amazonica]|uniref:coiled-coil domain-containing protein 146 n=1 Tax=Thalassophryne amazonica TaxID=390379 RepID=UPI001470B4D9|nr:coiled-coil domain-containing protein 146 [Thalassophryne amazonica]
MSQSEENQGCSPGDVIAAGQVEEKQLEEETPVVATAPNAPLSLEQPTTDIDVCAILAFQSLDELLSHGKICSSKAARLKASYRLLLDTLKSTQDSELQLLGEAKRCHAELKRLQAEVERMEEQSISEEPQSEVGKLRQQLLQAYIELKAAEDAEYKTQCELECLWEEKRCLERENETQPETAEVENRTKDLQEIYEELKKEVAQRQLEMRGLIEDLEAHDVQILTEQKDLEDKKEIIQFKLAEKARLIAIPAQISNGIQRLRSKIEATMKMTEALNKEISEMGQSMKELDESNQSLRMRKKEAMKELEHLKTQAEASQKEFRQLLKQRDVHREEEAVIMGNRGILEMKLQNIMCERKHLYESQSMQRREKNRQVQTLQRMEHALNMASEQLQHKQSIYSVLQAQIDAVPKVKAGMQRRMELQDEVDALRVCFEKQQSSAEENDQKKQQDRTIQELLRESNHLREELHDLRCLTQIKVEERGQKHRGRLRAEQMHQHIQQELRHKVLIITEHKKLNATLQRRILQCCKLCDMIMEERNKYVKLKQIALQTITELTEQVKVLENETEIQHNVVFDKDRSLTKARMKISHSCKKRDRLHNNISKVSWKHHQVSEEFEDNKLELEKLSQRIELQEQTLLETTENHEAAAQRRSLLGVQLLEHEEVLCSYYEKVNLQEAAISKITAALETLEKEIRDLKLSIKGEKRQIELKKREVPLKKKMEGEITTLQIELSEARDQTVQSLTQILAYKELKGADPSNAELVKKSVQLEVKLAEREKQVLEKELLLDQVIRLSKPMREKAENCKQDRLSLAIKLNELRAHIISTSHRMMATSAELSMKHAVALSLQQQIKEKEFQMERCQRRLEQGLPPCPEMEEEWRRMLRDKQRRRRDKEERERMAEEDKWRQLPNGVYTTAEARPNAYVPDDDLLPLPKPYGALAPCKPPQPGANMRHYHKPTPKPVEI